MQDGENATLHRLDKIIELIQELPKRLIVFNIYLACFLTHEYCRISNPYSQLYRLEGGTRMDNENWESKFPAEVYLELFR